MVTVGTRPRTKELIGDGLLACIGNAYITYLPVQYIQLVSTD